MHIYDIQLVLYSYYYFNLYSLLLLQPGAVVNCSTANNTCVLHLSNPEMIHNYQLKSLFICTMVRSLSHPRSHRHATLLFMLAQDTEPTSDKDCSSFQGEVFYMLCI